MPPIGRWSRVVRAVACLPHAKPFFHCILSKPSGPAFQKRSPTLQMRRLSSEG